MRQCEDSQKLVFVMAQCLIAQQSALQKYLLKVSTMTLMRVFLLMS